MNNRLTTEKLENLFEAAVENRYRRSTYLVKQVSLLSQFSVAQKRRQKLEQVNQQLLEQNPSLETKVGILAHITIS